MVLKKSDFWFMDFRFKYGPEKGFPIGDARSEEEAIYIGMKAIHEAHRNNVFDDNVEGIWIECFDDGSECIYRWDLPPCSNEEVEFAGIDDYRDDPRPYGETPTFKLDVALKKFAHFKFENMDHDKFRNSGTFI